MTNIRRIGLLRNGLPVYVFSYRYGGPEQVGLMSDDVRKKLDAIWPGPGGEAPEAYAW